MERLARDSPRDHPTIVEVLSAFIRTTTPQPTQAPPTTSKGTCPDQTPTADVQTALTVLGRRNTAHGREAEWIYLVHICLRHVDLSSGDFTGTNFRFAALAGANLRRTNSPMCTFLTQNSSTPKPTRRTSLMRISVARTSPARTSLRRISQALGTIRIRLSPGTGSNFDTRGMWW